MPYPTPNEDPTSPTISRVLTAPATLWPMLMGALWVLGDKWAWEPYGDMSPADAAALAAEVIDAMSNATWDRVGTLVFYMTQDPPAGALPCNGGYHEIAQYPALFDRLGPAYRVDDDLFRVPDLRGRAPVGPGDFEYPGLQLGSATVTLTVGNLPAHSHSVHTHGVAINIEEPLPGGPYPITTPSLLPGETGSVGSADPVSIVGPRLTVGIAIWAV